MSAAFERADAPTAAAEGGYVFDPADAGGETHHGITVAVARSAGFKGKMKDMTAAEAKAIRKRLYWDGPGLDRIAVVSEAVAAEVYDTGINMGQKTAGKFLQRALNVLTDSALVVDGALGPATLSALRALVVKRGKAGEAVLAKALNCLQGARYIELAEGRPANRRFVFGWIANRVML